MTKSLTCLIPAHDEAARIAGVLAAALDHPLIDEVIVIDDGSTDGTAGVAEVCGARVIRLAPNRGKSAALAAGLAAARARAGASHVMMLDADLTGLRAADLTALIGPVWQGRADVSLSLRGNAPWVWRRIGVDYITGERVLPLSLLAPCADALDTLPRFGLEVFLNERIRASGLAVAIVSWPRVASPSKARKRGRLAGLRADLAMIRDMFRTVTPRRALAQILFLRGARPRA